MDRLKINTTAHAVVACVGVVCVAAIVIAMIIAGWSGETIVAFGALALSLVTGQIIQTHKSAKIEAKTDQQTETLDQIVDQTNGKSEQQLRRVADLASEATLRRLGGGR